jgi:hypothetical protein
MEVSWSYITRLLTEPLWNSWFGELELLPDWGSVESGAELEDPQAIRHWYEHSCPYHSVTKKTVKFVQLWARGFHHENSKFCIQQTRFFAALTIHPQPRNLIQPEPQVRASIC